MSLEDSIEEQIEKWMNPLRDMMVDFQMWTWKFLNEFANNPEKYPHIKDLELTLMMRAFNFWDWIESTTSDMKGLRQTYFGTPKVFLESMYNRQNSELNDKWRRMSVQFRIFPREWLDTFSLLEMTTIYSSEELLSAWLVIAISLFVLGSTLYTKKDFR